ncbi:MAG: hypothetical protein EPO42_12530 [Gallionellaceae bacterium]|nr:MAG: hypothetical protein EPO42_12530 [Gallionellaceae bacterium]
MKIFLGFDSDENIVYAFGHGNIDDDDEGSPPFSCNIKAGKKFLGLSFDELKIFDWVETDDDGNLIGKGKRL